MVPLDVRPENIKAVFELLEHNPKCLGGAIAVPYKETIFKFIQDRLPENIKQIGAVNCFYRQKRIQKISLLALIQTARRPWTLSKKS